jgi:pyruvate-ferredoxin/flavodoxin oxidoreductase
VVARNLAALDASLGHLEPLNWQGLPDPAPEPPQEDRLAAAPAFVREVIGPMLERRGDDLPVSALPCDGTWPVGTAQWEKRNIATEVPVWEGDLCVQCGKCVLVCPHAVIRAKVAEPEAFAAAPEGFRTAPARDHAFAGHTFTIQVAAEDCTGCALCVDVCPRPRPQRAQAQGDQHGAAAAVAPAGPRQLGLLPAAARGAARSELNLHKIGQQQLQQPLFEFSGACGGCGETPYLKLASQLFGDRMLIANATGCSSIYGGNLPTTPWTVNGAGRGPAWSNSLFEDNAEFGYGMRVALDQQRRMALDLLGRLVGRVAPDQLPPPLVAALGDAEQGDEAAIVEQRQRVAELKARLQALLPHPEAEGAAEGERRHRHRRPPAAGAGRCPGEDQRVAGGRRRLGLRHRLRRPRPRARRRPRRECPGARHRGVLQHRRPGLQGHPPGGGGQVCCCRASRPARRIWA